MWTDKDFVKIGFKAIDLLDFTLDALVRLII